jgi:arsenate reductase
MRSVVDSIPARNYEEQPMSEPKRVLILCTGNSARSQMAEALLRHDGGPAFEVHSAGTKPSHVRPEAIEAMKEAGIDISAHRSKSVDEFAGQEFDYVVTVCDNAKESCPVFPGKTERIHWGFEDPAAVEGAWETRLAAFRRIRDEIRERFRDFIPVARGDETA